MSLEELRQRFQATVALGRRVQWVPHGLFSKQQEFADLDCLEALYGGAAGGGKTDALLAAALEYFDEPGYSALILRRTFPDLALPNAIMDRSHRWLDSTDARWNDRDKRWTSPKGAILQFGYCDTETDLTRYKSAEFQFVGIDELTEWPEEWYTFLFSRIRRTEGVNIPLRMRAATNPDGIGAEWVRQRFDIPLGAEIPVPIWRGANRVFWPARAEDNPSLDLVSYELALEQMAGGRDTVRWRQLREGLWFRDGKGLVYAGFDVERNVIDEAPKCKYFVLAIDYGFTDECSFTVLGWRDHDPNVYILESWKQAGLTPSDAAQATVMLAKLYPFVKIVGDIGGLGKGYAEEARKRFRLPIEPAEKNNKRGYIDLFNGDLKHGKVLVVRAKCQQLIDEWLKLPWDRDRKAELAGFSNHCADGALYGWRACVAYLNEALAAAAPPGSPEALAAEEKRMEQQVDEELEDDEADAKRRAARWWT